MYRQIARPSSLLVTTLAIASVVGCTSTSRDIQCSDQEFYDPAKDVCVPKRGQNPVEDTGGDDGSITPDADTGPPDGSPPGDASEVDGDVREEFCDRDNDRSLAKRCGGNDCDDTDPRRSPKIPERCDNIDNNCSGEVNDGLDCSFYAHEDEKLYKINPFQTNVRQVGENLPGLHDIDTHPDGTLYGVTPGGFYRFDDESGEWTELRDFPEDANWVPADPNGMAIGRRGTIYVTSRDKLYTIEKREEEGEQTWWVSEAGSMGQTEDGATFTSSGDAVINKRSLYVTSKHADDQDHLVTLDRQSGEASQSRGVGHSDVYGLTSAWGHLYGLTVDGKLIDIVPESGESTVVHTFEDRSWYGAASTPRRRK